MSQEEKLKWYGWGLVNKTFDLSRRHNFWPFLREKLELTSNETSLPIDISEIKLPASESSLASKFESLLGANAVSCDTLARLTHSMGKSYLDLIRIRKGQIKSPPDFVLYPETEDQVLKILQLANDLKIAVVPFGGGTSVVGGLEALKDSGHKAVLSLDLGSLNKVVSIDETSLLATIEAGMMGPALEKSLQAQGYTLGHYPQSFEFSSLGGWIAARSAGQQSNKYGRVEDMVSSLTIVNPLELITTLDAPASAAGPSIKQLLIGSEGIFGVITKAKMRVHKLPSIKNYRGILFKDFFSGAQAIRTIIQLGLEPATIRLSDELETGAFMKMRPESESMLENALSRSVKWYLKNRGYNESPCLMILGFEASDNNIKKDVGVALEICKNFDGLDLGLRVGQHWYKDRFALPYLRDTLLDNMIMIDTLETATTWSNFANLYKAVQNALISSIKSRNCSPMVFCHISHSYHDGASLYFTLLAKQIKGFEIEQWYEVKRAASDAIIKNGGTISHHHGVGRDHAPWAQLEHGKLAIAALNKVKQVFDPQGILNPGKLIT
ncbi:MAG: FAD-binding oxidoreductase [Acidobacteria bacterium]|nr:FAD-binding oxidoreductase [Acidobacteriota bacterium]